MAITLQKLCTFIDDFNERYKAQGIAIPTRDRLEDITLAHIKALMHYKSDYALAFLQDPHFGQWVSIHEIKDLIQRYITEEKPTFARALVEVLQERFSLDDITSLGVECVAALMQLHLGRGESTRSCSQLFRALRQSEAPQHQLLSLFEPSKHTLDWDKELAPLLPTLTFNDFMALVRRYPREIVLPVLEGKRSLPDNLHGEMTPARWAAFALCCEAELLADPTLLQHFPSEVKAEIQPHNYDAHYALVREELREKGLEPVAIDAAIVVMREAQAKSPDARTSPQHQQERLAVEALKTRYETKAALTATELCQLGDAYKTDVGDTERNDYRARNLYLKAVAQDQSLEAMDRLAALYEDGRGGVHRNAFLATAWRARRARENEPPAAALGGPITDRLITPDVCRRWAMSNSQDARYLLQSRRRQLFAGADPTFEEELLFKHAADPDLRVEFIQPYLKQAGVIQLDEHPPLVLSPTILKKADWQRRLVEKVLEAPATQRKDAARVSVDYAADMLKQAEACLKKRPHEARAYLMEATRSKAIYQALMRPYRWYHRFGRKGRYRRLARLLRSEDHVTLLLRHRELLTEDSTAPFYRGQLAGLTLTFKLRFIMRFLNSGCASEIRWLLELINPSLKGLLAGHLAPTQNGLQDMVTQLFGAMSQEQFIQLTKRSNDLVRISIKELGSSALLLLAQRIAKQESTDVVLPYLIAPLRTFTTSMPRVRDKQSRALRSAYRRVLCELDDDGLARLVQDCPQLVSAYLREGGRRPASLMHRLSLLQKRLTDARHVASLLPKVALSFNDSDYTDATLAVLTDLFTKMQTTDLEVFTQIYPEITAIFAEKLGAAAIFRLFVERAKEGRSIKVLLTHPGLAEFLNNFIDGDLAAQAESVSVLQTLLTCVSDSDLEALVEACPHLVEKLNQAQPDGVLTYVLARLEHSQRVAPLLASLSLTPMQGKSFRTLLITLPNDQLAALMDVADTSITDYFARLDVSERYQVLVERAADPARHIAPLFAYLPEERPEKHDWVRSILLSSTENWSALKDRFPDLQTDYFATLGPIAQLEFLITLCNTTVSGKQGTRSPNGIQAFFEPAFFAHLEARLLALLDDPGTRRACLTTIDKLYQADTFGFIELAEVLPQLIAHEAVQAYVQYRDENFLEQQGYELAELRDPDEPLVLPQTEGQFVYRYPSDEATRIYDASIRKTREGIKVHAHPAAHTTRYDEAGQGHLQHETFMAFMRAYSVNKRRMVNVNSYVGTGRRSYHRAIRGLTDSPILQKFVATNAGLEVYAGSYGTYLMELATQAGCVLSPNSYDHTIPSAKNILETHEDGVRHRYVCPLYFLPSQDHAEITEPVLFCTVNDTFDLSENPVPTDDAPVKVNYQPELIIHHPLLFYRHLCKNNHYSDLADDPVFLARVCEQEITEALTEEKLRVLKPAGRTQALEGAILSTLSSEKRRAILRKATPAQLRQFYRLAALQQALPEPRPALLNALLILPGFPQQLLADMPTDRAKLLAECQALFDAEFAMPEGIPHRLYAYVTQHEPDVAYDAMNQATTPTARRQSMTKELFENAFTAEATKVQALISRMEMADCQQMLRQAEKTDRDLTSVETVLRMAIATNIASAPQQRRGLTWMQKLRRVVLPGKKLSAQEQARDTKEQGSSPTATNAPQLVRV